MEGLELLPHVGRVEELDQHSFPGTETACFRLGDGGEDLGRMMHEKSLLRVDPRLAKARANQAVFQPVPANMAGQILFSGPGEQVATHFLTVISTTSAGGYVLGELFPEFPVIER